MNGKPQIVEIQIKVDPPGDHLNMTNNYGMAALAYAISQNKAECSALLRTAGGGVNDNIEYTN